MEGYLHSQNMVVGGKAHKRSSNAVKIKLLLAVGVLGFLPGHFLRMRNKQDRDNVTDSVQQQFAVKESTNDTCEVHASHHASWDPGDHVVLMR